MNKLLVDHYIDVKFSELKYFFVDIDRTLIQWKKPVIGAQDFIHTLNEADKKVVYHTDNTLFTRKEMAKKLRFLDIPAEGNRIMTSAAVAADKMVDEGKDSVYVVGEQCLMEEFRNRGIEVTSNADTVVVGMDRQFNYSKLRKAGKIAEQGEIFVCSSEKMLGSDEFKPNQLAINNALETFAEPKLLGKPSDAFVEKLRELTYEPGKTMVIGDRLADVRLGKKLGAKTALVTSGEADVRDLKGMKNSQKPDCVVSSLPKLSKRIV